jgi:hypothetical protein
LICSFNFLILLAVYLNISTIINIKILTNSNQQTQSYKFTSHIAAFLSVVIFFPLLSLRVDLDRTLLWVTGRVYMSYKKQKLLKLHEHHGFILPVFRWFVLFIFSVFCFCFILSVFVRCLLIFSPVFSNVYLIWRFPNILGVSFNFG